MCIEREGERERDREREREREREGERGREREREGERGRGRERRRERGSEAFLTNQYHVEVYLRYVCMRHSLLYHSHPKTNPR